MKIELNENVIVNGKVHAQGEVIDPDDETAQEVIDKGFAQETDKPVGKPAKKTQLSVDEDSLAGENERSATAPAGEAKLTAIVEIVKSWPNDDEHFTKKGMPRDALLEEALSEKLGEPAKISRAERTAAMEIVTAEDGE